MVETLHVLAFANVFCCVLALSTLLLKASDVVWPCSIKLHLVLSAKNMTPPERALHGEKQRHGNHSASSPGEKILSWIEGSVKGTVNVSWPVYAQVSALIKQRGCILSKASE